MRNVLKGEGIKHDHIVILTNERTGGVGEQKIASPLDY